jgi:hypothetical protein
VLEKLEAEAVLVQLDALKLLDIDEDAEILHVFLYEAASSMFQKGCSYSQPAATSRPASTTQPA